MRGLPDNNNLATGLIMKILRLALLLSLAPFFAASAHALSVHYDYDGAYNRTDEFTRDASGTLIKHLKYHYDAAGRLTAIENVTDPAQTETIGYDDNGNQTSRTVGTQQTLYSFDARDQLVEVKKGADNAPPALIARYRYNADGMRVDGEEEGAARRYTWDEDELIQTREPDATLSRYQWGPHRVASLLSTENGVPRRDWYFFDALGSVTALVSDSGELSATYRFDAFGKITEQTGESNNRFTFTGHQFDDVSDLYYFKARYYDPLQGRFISEDSFEGLTTTPESRNGYIYANANPNVYIDDDGHVAGTIIGGITGSVWGASQMVGGLAYDTYNHLRFGEGMRSAGEYGSVFAQNAIGGAEMGASFDVTVSTGGLAAFAGSGALGTAGFGALSFDGKAKSWDKFGKDQVKDAAIGAAFGVGAKVVAPIASKLGTKAIEKSAVLQKAVAAAGAKAEQLATRVAKSSIAKDVRTLAAVSDFKAAEIREKLASALKEAAKPPQPLKPIIEVVENASQPGAKIVAKSATGTSTERIAQLSDHDFIKEIAKRAEAKGVREGLGAAGTGPTQGTKKHTYAEQLLNRYQAMTGQRANLVTEQSFLGGIPAARGTSGSARPDVFDTNTGTIYDYKFVRVPGQGLPLAQQIKNAANVPGVTKQIEVNP